MKNRLVKQISTENFHSSKHKGKIQTLVVEENIEGTRPTGRSSMRWSIIVHGYENGLESRSMEATDKSRNVIDDTKPSRGLQTRRGELPCQRRNANIGDYCLIIMRGGQRTTLLFPMLVYLPCTTRNVGVLF